MRHLLCKQNAISGMTFHAVDGNLKCKMIFNRNHHFSGGILHYLCIFNKNF